MVFLRFHSASLNSGQRTLLGICHMPLSLIIDTFWGLSAKMADHYRNHRCLIEKNVPIAFIFPSRWQDESLGIETTSCLWLNIRCLGPPMLSGSVCAFRPYLLWPKHTIYAFKVIYLIDTTYYLPFEFVIE